uniref:Glycylpeptide N-tetradecanoyltransferase n=1 Tax=Sus scrofa TaxID=9823 RepID=A0A8D0NTR8_PIG
MADESETAVKPPAPPLPQMMEGNGNGHEHCSDCENEEDNSYNRGGLSPANDTGAKKKKKKQKKKKEKGSETDSAQDQPMKMNSLPAERIQEIQKAIELFSVGQGPAKTMEEASKRSYQFWDTQPVPKLGEVVNTHGPVEPDKDNIRQEPYTLPQGFTWDALDLGDRGVLKELYTLLNENYVEDDDNMFRFDYSPEFLLWALRPPGWLPQWHCGVRVVSSRKLVGFISAIPANIHIYDTEEDGGDQLPLCPQEAALQESSSSPDPGDNPAGSPGGHLPSCLHCRGGITKARWHLQTPKTAGLRPMEKKDIPVVHQLLTRYLRQFHLTPVMSQEEVEHWFYPQENIIDTFVNASGEVTDFLSFYTLPSTIMNHPTHKSLKAAYSFYNVHTQTPLLDLMSDALVLAKMKGFDVFNALDLMENKTFLEKLKFGIGDGNLQYYLYNWKCPSMGAEKVGLVLQ